ncbi:MAG TPA: 50S ribosomal protein L11 methyltransferase [Flavisolibacter sp.]|nr:50S ribosomal protein L11 methyltransferase [Flavisolibacter sp.]
MATIQISIEANEAQQELLISALSDYGAEGFEQTADLLIAYFPEQNFNSYDVNEILKSFVAHSTTIEEQNWNAVWESNFQPVEVGRFCRVRAAFHETKAGFEHEIIITPKMSFGTGHHATTFMMIEQMSRLDFDGRRVFDFGTGTGILSILAEQLGAASVQAIDVDHWSIENAHENVLRNHCSRISLSLTSTVPAGPFDIILANINRNVIVQYLSQLNNALGDGYLLLSGLLGADEHEIVDACEQEGLHFIQRAEKGQWISLLFMKGI